MRAKGSILIVVLGLLAILAVVGITYVTMSSIDRSAAANFALQTQFDLSADGAVDFVCHSGIQDIWECARTPPSGWSSSDVYSGCLLTGQQSAEPYDFAGADTLPSGPFNDPWLTSTMDDPSKPPTFWSYKGPAVTMYGLTNGFAGTTLPSNTGDVADNMGLGFGTGIWVPELASPYEAGVIRISVNVIDHGGMINLNSCNGGPSLSGGSWKLQPLAGQGYFIGDVASPASTTELKNLILSTGPVPGIWYTKGRPASDGGAIVIENPNQNAFIYPDGANNKRGADAPFTLDDEFELRRYASNPFSTRIKQLAPNLLQNATAYKPFLTTVSWTSQVMGDLNPMSAGGTYTHIAQTNSANNWSPHKADVNYDTKEVILNALKYSGTSPVDTGSGTPTWGPQFVANLLGYADATCFRFKNPPDGTKGCGIWRVMFAPSGGGGTPQPVVSASRQPLLSKVQVGKMTAEAGSSPTTYQCDVKVQVMTPWPNDTALDPANDGLSTPNMKIEVDRDSCTISVTDSANAANANLPAKMYCPPAAQPVYTVKITKASTNIVSNHLKAIKIHYTGNNADVIIDQVNNPTDADPNPGPLPQITLDDGTNASIKRNIYWEDEDRLSGDAAVRAVYIGPWITDGGASPSDINTFAKLASTTGTSCIPIRFPRSDDGSSSELAPAPLAAEKPFKSIPRLGDLDQIMCPINYKPIKPAAAKDFWPWTNVVGYATRGTSTSLLGGEQFIKFDWTATDSTGGLTKNASSARANAPLGLTVGGPWNDGLDNDGDGTADDGDKGILKSSGDQGRFAGPELRVAGQINLNTASTLAMNNLQSGVYISGLTSTVSAARNAPILSPAAIPGMFNSLSVTNASMAKYSWLEKRDEPWSRISNIVNVRSDTFSVYGTIQFGMVMKNSSGINFYNVMRSRRFWALIDRSPVLAYAPKSGVPPDPSMFGRPRVMTFQWLN